MWSFLSHNETTPDIRKSFRNGRRWSRVEQGAEVPRRWTGMAANDLSLRYSQSRPLWNVTLRRHCAMRLRIAGTLAPRKPQSAGRADFVTRLCGQYKVRPARTEIS